MGLISNLRKILKTLMSLRYYELILLDQKEKKGAKIQKN